MVKVNLTGRLQPWVSAKDVILTILRMLTTKGNVGTVIEYGGDGVKTLSVPERATITNMGAELGVTTSVFPSDEITKSFLKAQRRESDWISLTADDDARYDKIIDLDLGNSRTPHGQAAFAGQYRDGKGAGRDQGGPGNGRLLHELILSGPDACCLHA